jgi:pimeloyl-ACP methyl ester carboxylesterase
LWAPAGQTRRGPLLFGAAARTAAGVLAVLCCCCVAAAEVLTARVPLEDGRLPVRRAFEEMLRQAGVEPGEALQGLDCTIDLGTAVGRLQVAVFDRLAPGTVRTEVGPEAVVVSFDREALRVHALAVTGEVTRWFAATEAAGGAPRTGMTLVTRDDPRAPLAGLAPGTRRAVVLVHGLDDPGWSWRDMAPRLLDAGWTVVRFEYPNDQCIARSADLLAAGLAGLRSRGIEQVDVVAHSMGGLVSRDALTRAEFYAGDGSGRGSAGRLPAVRRLLMLGTPNHGSPMARVRALGEAGEKVSRWLSGLGAPQAAAQEPAGEAGRDLLPDSAFLRELNGRPLPSFTTYTIVAGRMSPFGTGDVDALAARVDEATGGAARREAGAVARWLHSVVSGLGDGLVSIESARLSGVSDMVIVEANHMGMIVNLLPSDSVPPAIPIVLARLSE